MAAAVERIFGATIFFGADSITARAKVVQRSRFNFLREARIWYNRQPDRQALGEEFYQEILAHPVPTDLEAVKLLSAAPAVLDLFMWLTYRCFTAKGLESIPIFGEFGLVSQLGSVEYSRPRRFRAELERWLSMIHVIWPECPARLSSGGSHVTVAPAFAVRSRPIRQFGLASE